MRVKDGYKRSLRYPLVCLLFGLSVMIGFGQSKKTASTELLPPERDALAEASVYSAREDFRSAIATLRPLVASKNPNPSLFVVLAGLYEKVEEFDNAADCYQRAL